MEAPSSFSAFVVRGKAEQGIDAGIQQVSMNELPPGDVVVRVAYSSLNYKDALAASGHPGIVKRFPHVPGIDASGLVLASDSQLVPIGSPVLVTGYELGAERWGGWSEYVRVPRSWIVPLPDRLSLRQAMAIGTAGFTAAQCLFAIRRNGVFPEHGPIVVTGASGGVGSIAVMLLSACGYEVHASTGKRHLAERLQELGATAILSREEFQIDTSRPLLSAKWAGAVDTVGGQTLAHLIRSVSHRGCVAACGMVGGTSLDLNIYPFILRGVRLIGIDSANCPYGMRANLWSYLSTRLDLIRLDALTTEVDFEGIHEATRAMLSGNSFGRTVIRMR